MEKFLRDRIAELEKQVAALEEQLLFEREAMRSVLKVVEDHLVSCPGNPALELDMLLKENSTIQ